jgi:chemotaxis protein histidine kinase CheA
MDQDTDLENVLEQLRLEYIENSGDKLDQIDDLIGSLLGLEGDKWRDIYIDFQRQIHTIKGTAGSYGFQIVTEIAHSLEDYLEASNNLGADQLSDVQLYIDQMRWIFEAGENPSEKIAAEILRKLPNPNKSSFSDQEIRQIPVILVMPYNIQRKIIANELSSCGFRVFIADTSVRAIELALTHKPTIVFSNYDISDINGVELALVFRSIEATKSINLAILSSQKATNQQFASLPDDVKVIRKGEEFSEDLAECLLDWRVFIKEARRSQTKNERSHLRISFNGMVAIKKNDIEYLGKTVDISAGGLAVKFNSFEKEGYIPFERGDRVTLDVEELSTISGSVIRAKKDNIIVRFDLDQHLEDRLLAEIMIVTNKIDQGARVEWGDIG